MLNAVRAPLVHADLAKDGGTLVKKFVYDTFFGRFFEVLKCMLYNKGSCLVTRKRSPFPLERIINAVHHKWGFKKRMFKGKEGYRLGKNRRCRLSPREFHDLKRLLNRRY